MSIIGTIRNKFTWLLLLLVGFAILAFLMMDGSNGQGSAPGANKAVGKVGGAKITAINLQDKSRELKNIYPNANDEQIQNTAWNDLIDERLFNSRYDDLGLTISKQEMADLLKGENPHQFARQVFSSLSETGEYDQFKAIEIVDDPKSTPQGEVIVKQLIHAIKGDKMNNKYSALLKAGVNTPTWLAQNEFVLENKTVNFDYVFLPFSLIDDEEVGEITDADLIKAANKNKKKYEANDGVILQYVTFDPAPSKEDSTSAQLKLRGFINDFKTTDKPEQFARSKTNSANLTRLFNPSLEFQTESSMRISDVRIKEQILGASTGDVVGPVVVNGELLMVKVLDKKNVADSARVRHILIPMTEGYDNAKNLADSLAGVLKTNKSKFGAFVTEYSSDPGSKDKGGVYEYFPQGQMVPAFNEASFNGKIGEIQVVETNYGFHIVEPLARKGSSPGVKIVPLMQTIKATSDTRTSIYNDAKEFEQNAQSQEDFVTNSTQYGGFKTTPSVSPNATSVTGIGQSYELVRWANNNGVGAVKYFNNIEGKTFVVRIKGKTVKGEIDLDNYRPALTSIVRNERKMELLKTQISDNGGVNQPMADLANKLGRTVQSATDAKFGGSGAGIGFEPELISSLFLYSEGPVGNHIEGRRGLYVADIKSFSSLPSQTDFSQYKTTLNNSMQSKAAVGYLRTQLVENGIIKDERYKSRF